jgi:hypothetical protein
MAIGAAPRSVSRDLA